MTTECSSARGWTATPHPADEENDRLLEKNPGDRSVRNLRMTSSAKC